MDNDERAYEHPLAAEHLSTLEALRAKGQTVGARGYHMQITGLFYWGFVIYRCEYSDDALFNRFITYFQQQADRFQRRVQQNRTSGLYLELTIMQDREALDWANKDEVRQWFIEWRDNLSVARDGPGADHALTPYLPRFEYCVHVGPDTLRRFRAYEAALAAGHTEDTAPPVVFPLVRAVQKPPGWRDARDPYEDDADDEDSDDDEYDRRRRNMRPAIEGRRDEDVGWTYVRANSWVAFYDELHDDSAWYSLYRRPPGIVHL